MRFEWWPAVLLEWESNEKGQFFWNVIFCKFSSYVFDGGSEKSYIDTNNNSPQILQ